MPNTFDADTKLEDLFNQSHVNSLPGAFYIYKIEGNTVKLKMWNSFFENILHYKNEELLDSSPYFFFAPTNHDLIKRAISNIIKEDIIKQIVATVKTAYGKQVPFILEGYKFKIGNDSYFTGLGLNISDLVSAKEQIQVLKLEREKIAKHTYRTEKKLLALALKENKSSFLLNRITLRLKHILKSDDIVQVDKEIKHLLANLHYEEKLHDNWLQFKELFINLHTDFFKKLKVTHPKLTENDLRFCAYLKINMATENLCIALNISKEGLRKKRYRLKKKLQIEGKASVRDYIRSFNFQD